MKGLRFLSLILALSLLLYIPAGAVDSGSAFRDSLYGKTMLVLGDSYTSGHGLDSPEDGWTSLLARTCGMTELNYSISGSSFAAGEQGRFPMVERGLLLEPDDTVDIILLQGGSNDHSVGTPIGSPEDRREDTFYGALNLILDHLQTTFPQAQIIVFSPWISNGNENSLGLTAQAYFDAMEAVCAARNLLFYNAADTGANGIAMNSEEFRTKFCLRSTDWYHLNEAGHRRFASVMARWISQALYGGTAADCFVDLQTADDALQDAVSAVVPAGILDGAAPQMFYPTRSATRETLALALYAMAGRPAAQDYAIADVSPDSEAYEAICYTLEAGILSGPDGFSPTQTLTRQMLATALCRYYTQVCGGQMDRLLGLGPFPDAGQVADYAKMPLGWALANGILSDKDGWLRPESAVSRGELAIALTAFLRFIGDIS